MCNIDYAGIPSFYYEETPKAKKEHTCCECRRVIKRGETYTKTSIGIEGTVDTYKLCIHCKSVAQWLNKHCGGWVFTEIKCELEEHYKEGYREDNLQKILIGIRRQWKSFRGDELLECIVIPT